MSEWSALSVLCCAGGANKRKGGRPGDMGHHDEYGSGRFGGQLDREMQFFEKVKARLRSKEQYQVCQSGLASPMRVNSCECLRSVLGQRSEQSNSCECL